jgi:hypothetical protein
MTVGKEHLMRCQECDQAATSHVTEIVEGKAVEYHLCEKHLAALDTLEAKGCKPPPWREPDPVATQKMAAYLLPALCLALLDEVAGVRLQACFWLKLLGSHAESALGALQAARQDPDPEVRKLAEELVALLEPRTKRSSNVS